VTLIVCTFDDTKVELTEDQRDAMYLRLGVAPPGWPKLNQPIDEDGACPTLP
jgi:hypothetical protein